MGVVDLRVEEVRGRASATAEAYTMVKESRNGIGLKGLDH